MKPKPILFPKSIPKTEMERSVEAMDLIAKIGNDDLVKLFTWEVEMIDEIRAGRAVTRIKLAELRETIKRLKL